MNVFRCLELPLAVDFFSVAGARGVYTFKRVVTLDRPIQLEYIEASFTFVSSRRSADDDARWRLERGERAHSPHKKTRARVIEDCTRP